jgi:hypothetical protein
MVHVLRMSLTQLGVAMGLCCSVGTPRAFLIGTLKERLEYVSLEAVSNPGKNLV